MHAQRLAELRDSNAKIHADLTAQAELVIAESRDLTAEEDATAAELQAAFDRNQSAIASLEAIQAREKTMTRVADPNTGLVVSDGGTGAIDKVEARSKAFAKAYQGPHPKHFFGAETKRHDRENAYKAGRWLAAALFGHEASMKWCKDHYPEAVQGGSNNIKGGVLVPTELEQAIIDHRELHGVLRRNVRVRQMGSDTLVIPRRKSGLTGYWIGESTDITLSDKDWTSVSLHAKKLAVLTKYSSELNEDAIISIADDLASEIGYIFAKEEDQAGYIGDGTSTYGGITGLSDSSKLADETFQGVYTAASGNDTWAEYTLADFDGVLSVLPEHARAKAKWHVHSQCFALSMSRLMSAAGGNTNADLARGSQHQFLGYPVEIVQVMDTTTDQSEIVSAILGDVDEAVAFGERRGITLAVSGDRYFEADQWAIRGTERVDIVVHGQGDATDAGPVVSLVGD